MAVPAVKFAKAARRIPNCAICTKPIPQGELVGTAKGPRAGLAHASCIASPAGRLLAGGDDYDGLIDPDEGRDPDAIAADRAKAAKSDPTPTVDDDDMVERIMDKVMGQVRSISADQNRMLKSQVDLSLRTTMDARLPEITSRIQAATKAELTPVVKELVLAAKGEMRAEVSRQMARIANEGVVRQVIEIREADKTVRTLEGEVYHPRFAWIMKLALAGKPIFIPGPTGCGKTKLAMQLADALKRPFGMVSCSPSMTETQLLGRSIPKITTGEELYRLSEFIRIYEGGGVFLLDELDASDPSVPLVLNAALANKRVAVPNRTDKPYADRHPDFVCIAAANTWGTGADRQYVGRTRLDEATLDRFRMGTVPLDYSPAVERRLCPDVELYDLLVKWRNAIRAEKLERVLSSRFFEDAYDMTQHGATRDDIARALFAGWRKEELKKVYGQEEIADALAA